MHAGPVHTGQTSFSTQFGGGYGMPSPHMFPGGGGYGIAPHVYPTQHTMERGGVMRDDWQWSPQCRQPSQPMHGGLSAPSPISVTRSAAKPSPSMADVQGEDMDEGWRVHSRTSSPAGLQGPSLGGEEDDLVGDDEVECDGGDIDGQNSDNAQEDRDSASAGQRDGGENVGGPQSGKRANKRGGKDGASKNKKQNIAWTLDERITLSRLMAEDDALMADADGQHRFKRSKDQYEWVHDRMAEQGFPHRSVEDCRKKWQGMLVAAKLILDKCENASGKPSYWDMTLEERKVEEVPLGFEKALWEAMEWKLNRPSIKCNKTLARMDDTMSGGTTLSRAMEDATRSYGEGLDKAAATLAKATSEAGSAIAAKIGDVADAMRGGNTVLEMLVGFLARRGGGENSAAYDRADTDPSAR
ncbi:hypothetical protein CBR_g55407 [Chara braunii]|uniref:Myb/SANT-like DNA-binding domain-containing protein n=1 Tax=Chara braunii TaxID=69332 RepID=A0A388K7N4_CHABU|nr:hypothetical protein CBR_g55407 [Chara braunii]|eukprot:GBG66064.1 hypothetical protein CBR_g55407 [Chara braunii]